MHDRHPSLGKEARAAGDQLLLLMMMIERSGGGRHGKADKKPQQKGRTGGQGDDRSATREAAGHHHPSIPFPIPIPFPSVCLVSCSSDLNLVHFPVDPPLTPAFYGCSCSRSAIQTITCTHSPDLTRGQILHFMRHDNRACMTRIGCPGAPV